MHSVEVHCDTVLYEKQVGQLSPLFLLLASDRAAFFDVDLPWNSAHSTAYAHECNRMCTLQHALTIKQTHSLTKQCAHMYMKTHVRPHILYFKCVVSFTVVFEVCVELCILCYEYKESCMYCSLQPKPWYTSLPMFYVNL